MARSVAALLAALALGIAGVVPGLAAAEKVVPGSGLSRIVSSGTLRVGMSGTQPPLNFEAKDGTMQGLEVDLVRSLAGLMGVELEIVRRPFAELLEALASGQVDLVASGMTATPERSQQTAFVGPYYLSGKSILTRSASLAGVDDAGDLDQSGLRFAALKGSTSEQFVRRVLPKSRLVTTPDYAAAVKLLLADEVSALVADREVVALTAFLHPKEGFVSLRTPLTIEPIGIAVPVGDAPLIHYLHNALNALEAGGILSTLRARWLERGDWVQHLP
ncbi:transporter substrate-binding domain-containing protein [Myxococcota bacterium]|nr:transporter substrate-binding domain-containing protein [Myxococcota bacterium]MCZ7617499.1 transporter substrate-binding domain-containing protein [Myxococcota bacterium]